MATRSDSDETGGASVADLLRDWFHVPALLGIVAAMLAIRLQAYDQFVDGEEVLFSGNDAWYHLREVRYTVRNWPGTMPFDPWTYFPFGTSVGQFGTLYDQLVATAALVVGLGAPSEPLVAKTLLVAPAVFGALAAIPTYLVGKRLAGRGAGVFAAVILALLPGTFLSRTLVGGADHNAAEPFFQAFAVFGLLAAFTVAQRDKPIWELVVDRDVEALRPTLLWSAFAGILTGLYMWVWPPGVLLVGIVGVFLLLKLTGDVYNGDSPEPVAFAGAVSMAVTALVMLVPLSDLSFSPTQFSLIQPVLALAVAAGSAFLAWLAREWEGRDLDTGLYPVTVFGIVLAGLVVFRVGLPDAFNIVRNNLLRTVGFSAQAQTRTIGEAQPYLSSSLLRQQGLTPVNAIIQDYGFTLFVAVLAAIWLLARPLVRSDDTRSIVFAVGGVLLMGVVFLLPALPGAVGDLLGISSVLVSLAIAVALIAGASLLESRDAPTLLFLIWGAFITAAAFTQVRFNYYLAVPVAVANALVLVEVTDYVGLDTVPEAVSDVKGYQVVAVLAVLMLVAAPVLLVPVGIRDTGNPSFDRSETAWQAATGTGPGGVSQWQDSLDWMRSETPAEGRMAGANGDLRYYGTYSDREDFAYPDGTYGVQSWWDYGHWITVIGERIPNANPFQQGASSAANYLLAPNETQAREVLASQSEEGERTRFVMVDWQMATPGSKFGAPIVFYDYQDRSLNQSQFYEPVFTQQFQNRFLLRHQRYYESQMVRLYEYHGSAREPQPIVVDWDQVQAQTQDGDTVQARTVPQGNRSVVRQFQSMQAAREFVRQDGTAQIGGVGAFPTERVPALEHYRLVKVSNVSAVRAGDYQRQLLRTSQITGVPPQALLGNNPSWVKTFERVPAATVEGSGAPPNANVTARVQMYVPTSNTTFTYSQRAATNADGEFTLTLPYSTAGYDEYGPENGYTNVSVRARGDYQLSTAPTLNESGYIVSYSGTVSVPEGAVNGDREEPLTVSLERTAQRIQTNNSTSGSVAADLEPLPATGGTASDAPSPTPPTADGDGAAARTRQVAPPVRVAPP